MRHTPAYWYGPGRGVQHYALMALLIPLSWGFCALVRLRRALYMAGVLPRRAAPLPVIVVGNITAGGSGKTPLVIWIADFLRRRGYRPGLVSRGYGGAARAARMVEAGSDPAMLGDEAVLLAARSACPVAVAPRRTAAVDLLRARSDVDVIVADDGLQHYAMRRDIEIAVIDGARRFGNGRCLPAGPLREKPARLGKVDMIVVNGRARFGQHSMTMHDTMATNMQTGEMRRLSDFSGQTAHALAAIGRPQRFFAALERAGIKPITHAFPDHYQYRRADVTFADRRAVLMTEKDAVKCAQFADARFWRVGLEVAMDDAFGRRLLSLLEKAAAKKHTKKQGPRRCATP